MKSKKIIGIDLGTTFSEVAYVADSGVVEMIPNLDGEIKTPSVISYATDPPVIGKAALQDAVLSPQFFLRCGKRSMGKRTSAGKPIPLLLTPSGKEITAIDSAAETLGFLKKGAETYLGCKIEEAVITVPAYFNKLAREDTINAARRAGFKQVTIHNEPETAAIFYELEKVSNATVVVIDSGGGTTDVTGVEIKDKSISVIVTDGDAELGGSNYDEAILNLACQEARANGMEISAEKNFADFNQMLERSCEAKEALSRRDETTLIIESEGKRLPFKITRDMVRFASRGLDERFKGCCSRLLKEMTARGKTPQKVLIVGGNGRLFHLPEMVEEIFGLEPVKDADADLVVAKGAAICAHIRFGDQDKAISVGGHQYLPNEIKMKTVAAHAICVSARKSKDDPAEYNCLIVPANTPLPYEFEAKFAPVNSRSTSVVVKLVQGVPDELSCNSVVIRSIDVPIKPSEHDDDRIQVKGKYTEEGLIELTIIDILLGKPISESFTYEHGLGA